MQPTAQILSRALDHPHTDPVGHGGKLPPTLGCVPPFKMLTPGWGRDDKVHNVTATAAKIIAFWIFDFIWFLL